MTLVTYTPKPDLDGATDVLVLGVAPDGDGARLVLGHALSRRPAAALLAAAATVGATGRAGQVHVVPATAGLRASAVVLVGLGEAPSPATLREAAGAALRAATALPASSSVLVDLPAADADALEAVTEGALLGAYTFTAHKGDRRGGGGMNDRGPAGVAEITIGGGLRVREGRDRVETARVAAESVAWARDLVNTAPNVLYPQSFVDRVRERIAADDAPVELRVIDEKELEELGCGGIIGVGRGSARPPRIAVLSYRPRRSTGHVALVGKGITFDTGGICIKPSADMWQMKSDMGGAAAVAGAVLAAARTGLPVAVTGYLCLAENMPDGNAQRPGDIVTMRDGMTVEVLDTDAEGRMVLADGICLAAEENPDAIIDIATLTGACMVALGSRTTGVMGAAPVTSDILEAAGRAGEDAWELPLPAHLRPSLDSPVADIAHKAGRMGGALTAGLFLKEFAVTPDDRTPIPWAHLDIAGPSFNADAPWGHVGKGGTGAGVTTLVRYLRDRA
ncbi:leucyl aminopeptidase [Janibacter massiliensis]|uniref:leucyl aminopeptidase n=1 Tax=Janibacter massiliensis TaxID=2058291 RepID=UPI001F1D40EA|nr:leucyl aminopeptidase [Janibacter massiliensis]